MYCSLCSNLIVIERHVGLIGHFGISITVTFFRKASFVRNVKLPLQDKDVNQLAQCKKVMSISRLKILIAVVTDIPNCVCYCTCKFVYPFTGLAP